MCMHALMHFLSFSCEFINSILVGSRSLEPYTLRESLNILTRAFSMVFTPLNGVLLDLGYVEEGPGAP